MLIELIKGTDYKYDERYRFYGWEYADEIKPVKDCGAETLAEFYLNCLEAWNTETCSSRFRENWSPENPSVGQCTITAALVHEYFGGEVLSLPLNGGGAHSFNRIDGRLVDLACEQFGKNALLNFNKAIKVKPEELLIGADKAERCELLRKRLLKIKE